jgi:hypothetical protein
VATVQILEIHDIRSAMTDSDPISLGNPFFEEKGNIINRRILSVEPEAQIEYTISLIGIINGNVSVTDIGTIVSTLRRSSNGIYYSQGQGIVTTNDGREMSTWTSQGIEYVTNEGKKSLLRGSAFYRSTSAGELAFLNNIMTVFKSETDEVGNISNKEWQWK